MAAEAFGRVSGTATADTTAAETTVSAVAAARYGNLRRTGDEFRRVGDAKKDMREPPIGADGGHAAVRRGVGGGLTGKSRKALS
ncbi:hypothetical protein GCM10009743_18920 [Kribbella swartbergensis]